MATVELNQGTFEDVVKQNDIVLVDFWADWCQPCRRFGPIYEQASENHPDIVFGKIDTQAKRELAGFFEVRSIPTLMVFREGVAIFRESGALPLQALEELIKQVRALDLAELREEIQKHAGEKGSAE